MYMGAQPATRISAVGTAGAVALPFTGTQMTLIAIVAITAAAVAWTLMLRAKRRHARTR